MVEEWIVVVELEGVFQLYMVDLGLTLFGLDFLDLLGVIFLLLHLMHNIANLLFFLQGLYLDI